VDPQRRNRYLDAIGVDVWVRRPDGALGGLPALGQPIGDVVAGEAADGVVAAVLSQRTADVVSPPAAAGPSGFRPALSASVPAAGAAPVRTLPPERGEPAAAPMLARPPAAALEPLSADDAARWETLRSEILGCTKCGLHKTRTQGVVGVGPHRVDWMVIGEAPGAEEDRKGEPFVGRAGHLLDAMLRAIGLDRGTNVYIANVLKSRPPGNRDPKPEEVSACLPYLMRQIALLQPRLMLAVGRIAAQNLLSTDMPLGRLRGKVHHFGELNTPLIVTYHPAYLLRTPVDKRKAWEDLKFARGVFRQLTDRVG
jgi:uracil-DNA glycosylase